MEIPQHLEKHFVKARIVTGLQHADVTEDFHFEPHGTTAHVAHFPHPGVICQFKLGSGGLQYQRGEVSAVIPLQELIGLFERVEPKFSEAPKPQGRATSPQAPQDTNVPSKAVAQPSTPSKK